jgi:hypothetical protein
MGLFEQQPLLLVPFILVVVAAYDLAKHAIRVMITRAPGRRSDRRV